MRRTLMLAPVAVFTILVGQGSVVPSSSTGPDPTHIMSGENPYDLTDEQLEFVAWGESRFIDAGLVPPRVEFVFHEDTAECRLRRGLYYLSSRTVEICNVNPETLIHEMAHAWVEANLTDAAKADFMQQRQLSVWNDHAVPWEERGTEHAATIVAWGVEDKSRLVTWVEPDGSRILRLLAISHSTPGELAAAYQFLTGVPVHPDRLQPDSGMKAAHSPEVARVTG